VLLTLTRPLLHRANSFTPKGIEIAVILALLFSASPAQGQTSKSPETSVYPDSLNKAKLATVLTTEAVFYTAGMSYLGFIWYKDHERVPFHWYNDSKGYLQVDKFGHAFGAYVESYVSYDWLRRSGLSRNKSLIIGGLTGAFLQFPIEVFDGLYEGWGFSMSDVAANTTGSALVVMNELLFQRQLIKYKFSFRQSSYAKQSNGYLGSSQLESLFYDYNGHTYWLSIPINSMVFKESIPGWIALSLGYSANGMFGEFSNLTSYGGVALPEVERHRQMLLSIDIDPSAINTRFKALNTVLDHLFWIKIPAPTLEYNPIDGLKFHPVYW